MTPAQLTELADKLHEYIDAAVKREVGNIKNRVRHEVGEQLRSVGRIELKQWAEAALREHVSVEIQVR